MYRRLTAPPAVLALAWALCPASAGASEMVGLRLANETSSAISELTFSTVPLGTIVPPVLSTGVDGETEEGSPLKALDSSTGLDTDDVYVLLGTESNAQGVEEETLYLLFGYTPNPAIDGPDDPPFLPKLDEAGNHVGLLEPGDVFDFELSLSDPASYTLLQPTTPALDLTLLSSIGEGEGETPDPVLPPPVGNPSEAPVPIPEPTTVLLWTALAGAGLVAARRRAAPRPA